MRDEALRLGSRYRLRYGRVASHALGGGYSHGSGSGSCSFSPSTAPIPMRPPRSGSASPAPPPTARLRAYDRLSDLRGAAHVRRQDATRELVPLAIVVDPPVVHPRCITAIVPHPTVTCRVRPLPLR